jgi:serine/threonine protein kinase
MGIGMQATVVYLIDFGLSKEYRDPNTYKHIPSNTNLGLTGTAAFASINSHLGLELGRRDDMESLAYILIYFLRGSLPWQGSSDIAHHKQRITPRELCRGLPAEFCIFLKYCRSLGFEEKPDYEYISDIFNDLLSREGLQNDVAFDWDGAENERPQSRVSDSPSKRANAIVQGQHDQSLKRREGYVTFLFVNFICLHRAVSRLRQGLRSQRR